MTPDRRRAVPTARSGRLSITTIRSASVSASSGSWVTTTRTPSKVASCSRSVRRTSTLRLRVERGERLVEQQRARLDGERARRAPRVGPGRPRARAASRAASAPSPSRASSSRARALAAALRMPRARGPNATLSSASRWRKSNPSWNISATGPLFGRHEHAGSRIVEHRPSSRIVPASTGARPAIARSSVALARAVGPDEHDELVRADVQLDVEVQRAAAAGRRARRAPDRVAASCRARSRRGHGDRARAEHASPDERPAR